MIHITLTLWGVIIILIIAVSIKFNELEKRIKKLEERSGDVIH